MGEVMIERALAQWTRVLRTGTMVVEGRPSGEDATEEVARARQRGTNHGEQLGGGFRRILGIGRNAGNHGEEVIGGGGESWVALADPEARVETGRGGRCG